MTKQRAFNVGGHIFVVISPDGMMSEKELMPYAPFETDLNVGRDLLFTLTLIDDAGEMATEGPVLADLEDENGRMTVFLRNDGGFTFHLTSVSGNECGRIRISRDYSVAEARIGGNRNERRYAFDTTLMLLYAFAASKHDTLLLHASVVERAGKGHLFLGKSGTGKSTHSRLWTKYVEGAELLNDDNPILRVTDEGKVCVYGSPWSGKTECYRNRKIPAGDIVRLHQAPYNKISPLNGVKAYAALLPSCSYMKWNREMADDIHHTLCRVVENVPVYSLECLPDRESAELSFNVLCK